MPHEVGDGLDVLSMRQGYGCKGMPQRIGTHVLEACLLGELIPLALERVVVTGMPVSENRGVFK